ncbi:MAG TPA: TetR/AcrR family transcriptional regulator [Pseudonocardia sp.]|jgi:AcrR family transcriptional regulator|nr:TetR/AcrR family transcriptional regulator [Pseudonocardia sp.]
MVVGPRARGGGGPSLTGSSGSNRDDTLRAAQRLFTDIGYRAVTLDAVAEATGQSRAAIRERHASTAEIFRELAYEAGSDLVRHAGRLGPIEADPIGLDELRVWIAGLSSVVHRRSTTIRLWPIVDHADHGLRRAVTRFLRMFADTLKPRLAKTDTAGVDPGVMATAVLALVAWAQLTRASQMPAIGESSVDDHLAVLLGNTLLPDSARPTWQGPPLPAPRDEITPRRRSRQVLPEFPEPSSGFVGLRRSVDTPRGRVVVDRVLPAALDVIRRQGYSGTSVADVVAAAGVPRGSFTAYWADRRALLQTLAHRAALAVREPLENLPTSDTRRNDLHDWIDRWLDVLAEHGPVLHVWVHETGNDIELGGLTVHLRETTLAIMDGLSPTDLPDESLERRVARVVMWALLVELPYALCVQEDLMPRAEVASVLALFLERGIPDRP